MERRIENIDDFLGTAAEMLDEKGLTEAVTVLKNSEHQVDEMETTDWEDQNTYFRVRFLIEAREYARLDHKRDAIIKKISDALVPLLNDATGCLHYVEIKPRVVKNTGWREPEGGIPKKIREDILYRMDSMGIAWHGDLSDRDFLGYLYDLSCLPSTDDNFQDASDEICHRREQSDEWGREWIFEDKRFQLMTDLPEKFLQFLCKTLDPRVRSSQFEINNLLKLYNEKLIPHRWHIIEDGKIGGRPCYIAKPTHFYNTHAIQRAAAASDALESGEMRMQIERIANAIDTDPAAAIGGSKELIESACKHILDKFGDDQYGNSPSMSDLTRAVAKVLELVAESTSNKATGAKKIKILLNNLSSLTVQIDDLRNMYGTGHGSGSNHKGLEPRHARLAFASAVAFIDFITESYLLLTEASEPTKTTREDQSDFS